MKVFIRSAGNISPQHSLDKNAFFQQRAVTSLDYFNCIEPAYEEFIDSKMIRRMSRIVKMGVSAAITCLQNGGVENPGAILTATAYGCLEDSSAFLRRMIEFEEKMLSPTAFIQSTHNTVGAQIALLLRCHNYNNTIVHSSYSFENALIESILLISEGMSPVLVGAIDELTSDRHAILRRFGLYKQTNESLKKESVFFQGRKAGEGAAFFLLDKEPGKNPLAILTALQTFYHPESPKAVEQSIQQFIQGIGLTMDQIDLVLSAQTGNIHEDMQEEQLLKTIFRGKSFFPFKSICGDYPTATGFALWLAALLIHEQLAPPWFPTLTYPVKNVLIHNHTANTHHSLFLISAC